MTHALSDSLLDAINAVPGLRVSSQEQALPIIHSTNEPGDINKEYKVDQALIGDAALVIEPLASIILKQNPTWKVIFNGAEGWKEITGVDGWEIVPAMRADAIAKKLTEAGAKVQVK